MPRHDQRFKDLLRAFFSDFLQLAVPEPARRLDLGSLRLLVNCVQTYLELNPEESAEYEALRASETEKGVRAMEMNWVDRLETKYLKAGREQGRLEGVRQLLLRQMALRFGPPARDPSCAS